MENFLFLFCIPYSVTTNSVVFLNLNYKKPRPKKKTSKKETDLLDECDEGQEEENEENIEDEEEIGIGGVDILSDNSQEDFEKSKKFKTDSGKPLKKKPEIEEPEIKITKRKEKIIKLDESVLKIVKDKYKLDPNRIIKAEEQFYTVVDTFSNHLTCPLFKFEIVIKQRATPGKYADEYDIISVLSFERLLEPRYATVHNIMPKVRRVRFFVPASAAQGKVFKSKIRASVNSRRDPKTDIMITPQLVQKSSDNSLQRFFQNFFIDDATLMSLIRINNLFDFSFSEFQNFNKITFEGLDVNDMKNSDVLFDLIVVKNEMSSELSIFKPELFKLTPRIQFIENYLLNRSVMSLMNAVKIISEFNILNKKFGNETMTESEPGEWPVDVRNSLITSGQVNLYINKEGTAFIKRQTVFNNDSSFMRMLTEGIDYFFLRSETDTNDAFFRYLIKNYTAKCGIITLTEQRELLYKSKSFINVKLLNIKNISCPKEFKNFKFIIIDRIHFYEQEQLQALLESFKTLTSSDYDNNNNNCIIPSLIYCGSINTKSKFNAIRKFFSIYKKISTTSEEYNRFLTQSSFFPIDSIKVIHHFTKLSELLSTDKTINFIFSNVKTKEAYLYYTVDYPKKNVFTCFQLGNSTPITFQTVIDAREMSLQNIYRALNFTIANSPIHTTMLVTDDRYFSESFEKYDYFDLDRVSKRQFKESHKRDNDEK